MSEQITLQKALFKIKKLKQLLHDQQKKTFEPVAIIGISCRFPQAVGKDAYWQMLIEGRNVMSSIPEERWDLLKGSDEIALRDPDYTYPGGYLSHIDAFDAYFFGISPREALRMDPQHRLLLEVAYEAIEDAGIPVEALAGSKTGVFASLYVSQLAHMQTMDNELDALFLPTGNAISIAANRISYLFDLHGPSVVVDSACSSSMASLYLACLNLQNKACDLALVCGAKLNILPYINYVLSKAKMLSPDGQCKTFDASANGYAQGEGVGVLMLKPLSKALQDKDRIYGVITGCAVNQDGKTNGLTAPNGLQQELMLRAAYSTANINPHDLSYVECHGTGTFLGDPIEIEALGEVIGKQRDPHKPCWIGSVKTNIGHLEPAAGVASVIKVALALKNATIPPHLHFNNPNPHIAFDKYHLRVPKQSESWPKYGEFRMAGVSGFGFGGTNAHVVIRELAENEQPTSTSSTTDHDEIFTLSAKDPQALQLYVEKWCQHLEAHPNIDLSQVCYNMHIRRSHYFYRLAIVAKSVAELIAGLRSVMAKPDYSSESIFTNVEKSKNTIKPAAPADYKQITSHQLATLYVDHANINWMKYEEQRSYPHIDMPIYPWQHKNYWPPLGHQQLQVEDPAYNQYPLRGKQVKSPLNTLQFEFKVDSRLIPDVQDTYNILHAGYYLEILAFAVKQLTSQTGYTVTDHEFLSPLMAPNNTLVSVQLVLEKNDDEHYYFHYYSNIDGQPNWVEHARGKLIPQASVDKTLDTIDAIKNRCPIHEMADKLYEKVIAMGMPAGESIRWTQQFWRNDKEILCEFNQPKFVEKNSKFTLQIHPSIIDGSIQPLFKLLPEDCIKPYIASGAGRITFHGIKPGPYYLYGILKEVTANGEKMFGDCYLVNANNELMAEFEDISLAQLDNKIQIEQIMQAKSQHNLDLASLPSEERQQTVTQFLVEQIAIIFSMPKADIEINRSLRDMGIDSLMALVLMKTLELGLGTTYSMHDLLEGPTIAELADFVVNNFQPLANTQTPQKTSLKKANWISFRQSRTNPDLRLFCFPYGGGGASIYREWQKDLPDNIEVCPIQLPGREDRLDEKPIGQMNMLVEQLIEALQPEFNTPFAFFGHSFGSLIAFELTRQLRRRGLSMPMHLFVSAFPDPRVPTKSLDTMLKQLRDINIDMFAMNSTSIANLTDDQLMKLSNIFNENGISEYGDHLMNKDIIKVLLPIFTGDMGLVKSYEYRDEAPFDLPITVFMGKRDTWVAAEDHLNWIEHTKQKCVFHVYDSGHLFIRDPHIKKDMLKKITQTVVVEETVV